MTQEELKLVLEALKWCHGGEPCGTSEAIAVVEKALAQPEQEPVTTVEDNSQQWKGMDGAIAFHLIERHADNLDDIRKMMGEWLSANTPQRTWQGLTDEEIAQGCKESWVTEQAFQSAVWWAEEKLKEKNT